MYFIIKLVKDLECLPTLSPQNQVNTIHNIYIYQLP